MFACLHTDPIEIEISCLYKYTYVPLIPFSWRTRGGVPLEKEKESECVRKKKRKSV